jgi:hypothetical protein
MDFPVPPPVPPAKVADEADADVDPYEMSEDDGYSASDRQRIDAMQQTQASRGICSTDDSSCAIM